MHPAGLDDKPGHRICFTDGEYVTGNQDEIAFIKSNSGFGIYIFAGEPAIETPINEQTQSDNADNETTAPQEAKTNANEQVKVSTAKNTYNKSRTAKTATKKR
jgi:hypothetical protein